MAFITCTIKEFHRFIGPFIRNRVNNLTSKARKERNGICEFCKEKKELQSAHIHGRGRRTIIEEVLEDYLDDGYVKGNLLKIEKKIMDAHFPLEKTFKFLCQPCHREYDNNPKKYDNNREEYDNQKPKKHSTIKNSDALQVNEEFEKLNRIEGWAKNPDQINSRIVRAFLEISEKRQVTLEELKNRCESKYGIKTFMDNFNQMKKDEGNTHGKVFRTKGDYVEIHPVVMKKIEKHFKYTIENFEGKMKIGKYVQKTFKELVEKNVLDEREIENLQNLDYSKKTFHIQYRFLVSENSQDERKRYYKYRYRIKNETYYLCSQWYESDRPYYEAWLKKWKRDDN